MKKNNLPQPPTAQDLYDMFKTYVRLHKKWFERTLILNQAEYEVFPFQDHFCLLLNPLRINGREIPAPIESLGTKLENDSYVFRIVVSRAFWDEIRDDAIWKQRRGKDE